MSEFTGISLDPEDTPQGAMERVFLAEAHSPAFDDYDAASDLVEMRNMREVFENRLKNPAEYEAPGAENEIDIVKMGHQFQGFANYPKIEAGIESNIKEIVKNANDPHHPQQAAYAQHVLNAIKAASENIAEHRKALKLALQEYFDQQSRLPPNGATGFDPRLTPAWPALQLPA